MRGYFGNYQTEFNVEQLKRDSFPTGTNPPYSLIMGDKGGLLSATTTTNGSGAIVSGLTMGKACAATINGTGAISSAALSLITQIASIINGTGGLTANLKLSIQLAANLAGAGDIIGAMSLLVEMATTLSGTGTFNGTLRGTATLEADLTPFTELSPENLASAVWNKLIEGSYSASDLMKLLSAVAAGKTTIVDLGGGAATITFRDVNDTTDRVEADMTDSERTNVTLDL